MTKSELRKIYLNRQKNLSSDERIKKSSQISNHFFRAFDFTKINFLHCFLPIEKFNEIDTTTFFKKTWREFPHVETFVPRVNFQTHLIESVRLTSKTKLVKNVWEIDEPNDGEIVDAVKIDVVLIPLLCFDERGFRVGYGRGFYDRFLKYCRADCLKIGLSYFAPVAEIADARDFDVNLDFCIAPQRIFTTKAERNTEKNENQRRK